MSLRPLPSAAERLAEIAKQAEEGNTQTATVRELLSWFQQSRRGYWVVERIRKELDRVHLVTMPDFESVYIDSTIAFISLSTAVHNAASGGPTLPPATSLAPAVVPAETGAFADPTYRISKLAAANNVPIWVPPDAAITVAVTLLLANDFSQLPVMTSPREVKGVIGWPSIGGRLALGHQGAVVRELMDAHHEIRASESLFAAIGVISTHGYVLVRGADGSISGIVTASDLSLQFRQLAEPFLLLGEIENHIRRIIDGRFTPADLNAAKHPADEERDIESVADMNFGKYLRLLETPAHWAKLNTRMDRATFIKAVDKVREIRNGVMHFDPDPMGDDELDSLRDFAKFLRRLQELGAT